MGAQSTINKALGAIATATTVVDKLKNKPKLSEEMKLAQKREAELKNIEALSNDIASATPSIAGRLKKHQKQAYEKFITQYPGTKESAKALELMDGNRDIERQKKAIARASNIIAAQRAQKANITRWINRNADLSVGGRALSELPRNLQEIIYTRRGELNGKK